MKLLQNFQYDELQSVVRYQPDGQLNLSLQFEGKNSDFFDGQKTHLNVNLDYNLLDLLESLRIANDVIENECQIKTPGSKADRAFLSEYDLFALTHRIKELVVGLGLTQFIEQEFNALYVFHFSQQATQNPQTLQTSFVEQHIFTTGARTTDVDRRVDTLRRFHGRGAVPDYRTFKFFEDNFVHFRTSINQRSRDDGQRATFFDVTCRTEETLWFLEGVSIDTTGQYLT